MTETSPYVHDEGQLAWPERSGPLARFSDLRTVSLAAVGIMLLFPLFRYFGTPGLIVGTVSTLLWIAALFVPFNRRTVAERAPEWYRLSVDTILGRRRSEINIEEAGIRGDGSAVPCEPPVGMEGSRVLEFNGIGVFHDASERTYTGMIRVSGDSLLMMDPEAVDRVQDGWGKIKAGFCTADSGVRRVGWMLSVFPESPRIMEEFFQQDRDKSLDLEHPVNRNYRAAISEKARPAAPREYHLLLQVGAGRAWKVLHKKAIRRARGWRKLVVRFRWRPKEGEVTRLACELLLNRLHKLGQDVQRLGLQVEGILTAQDYVRHIEECYDPRTRARHDRLAARLQQPRLQPVPSLDHAWPQSQETLSDCYVTNGQVLTRTYWLQEWPLGRVTAGFMNDLLLDIDEPYRAVVLFDPIPRRRALTEVERTLSDQQANQSFRDRKGFQTSRSEFRTQQATSDRADELISGHGDERYGMSLSIFVVGDAEDPETFDQLDDLQYRVVEGAAVDSGLIFAPAVHQGLAFTRTLGTGRGLSNLD